MRSIDVIAVCNVALGVGTLYTGGKVIQGVCDRPNNRAPRVVALSEFQPNVAVGGFDLVRVIASRNDEYFTHCMDESQAEIYY